LRTQHSWTYRRQVVDIGKAVTNEAVGQLVSDDLAVLALSGMLVREINLDIERREALLHFEKIA
jgi:hypothetical protein